MHVLKEIHIANVDKWDTAKAKDFVGTTNKLKDSEDDGKTHDNDLFINEEVKITEYAPSVFEYVKKMDNITPDMIKKSLSTEANHKSVFKAKESAGKSGSFFFFSYDRQFIIKTMNANEKKVFIAALPTYLKHLSTYPQSLIARIYGIFTVEMEDMEAVDLLLMANAAHCGPDIENVYDLKGSIVNRNVPHWSEKTDCLKDVNLLEQVKEKRHVNFIRKDMRKIMRMMFKDVKYLNSRNLMDYSLLLIIENNPEAADYYRKSSLKRKMSEKSDNLSGLAGANREPRMTEAEGMSKSFNQKS